MHQQFNIQQLYALSTLYLCVLYLSEKNSDLCHLQHKLIGFYNRDKKCLQRGTDWVFKQSSLPFVFKGLIKLYFVAVLVWYDIFNCSWVISSTVHIYTHFSKAVHLKGLMIQNYRNVGYWLHFHVTDHRTLTVANLVNKFPSNESGGSLLFSQRLASGPCLDTHKASLRPYRLTSVTNCTATLRNIPEERRPIRTAVDVWNLYLFECYPSSVRPRHQYDRPVICMFYCL